MRLHKKGKLFPTWKKYNLAALSPESAARNEPKYKEEYFLIRFRTSCLSTHPSGYAGLNSVDSWIHLVMLEMSASGSSTRRTTSEQ